MKKRPLPYSLAVCAFFIALLLGRSRFWDSQRVEKDVRANVLRGDTEKNVIAYLSLAGVPYRRLQNIGPSFTKQSAISVSHLNPNLLGSIVIGSTSEGFFWGDLYKIDTYFFFDRNGKLIKYEFFKMWRGM